MAFFFKEKGRNSKHVCPLFFDISLLSRVEKKWNKTKSLINHCIATIIWNQDESYDLKQGCKLAVADVREGGARDAPTGIQILSLACSDLEPGLTTHNLFAHSVPCLIALLLRNSALESSISSSSIPLVFLVSLDTRCLDTPVRTLVPPHTSAWYSLSTTEKRSSVYNLSVNKKPF